MRIDNPRRILPEDFEDEMQDFVTKFGETYNFTIENITNAINGQLDYSNLTKTIVTIEITVDAAGLPILGADFISDEGMSGSNVIKAINLTNPTAYVSSAPFMTYSRVLGTQYKVDHITGLISGNKYQLLIELIPSS